MVRLEDAKGHVYLIPVKSLGYVELAEEPVRKVGFAPKPACLCGEPETVETSGVLGHDVGKERLVAIFCSIRRRRFERPPSNQHRVANEPP